MNTKIGVIIATSMSRNDSLFNLSLKSVLLQTQEPDCIVIVDDNNEERVSQEIKNRIGQLANPNVFYLKNIRTKNMSGTGAWNTGIDFLKNMIGTGGYVAILDDDDSWDLNYLESIRNKMAECAEAVAVFAYLKRSECPKISAFTKDDLTIKRFLYGDPGIQGSNMCFRMDALLAINGFDEQLASCTDRDLMIRFLKAFGNERIAIIEKKLVNYFSHEDTVTNNYEKKEKGLDAFYRKHIRLFDAETLEESLRRAETLFKYPNSEEIRHLFQLSKRHIAVGIAVHNNKSTVRRCLNSVLRQKNLKRSLSVVIADDNSTDDWMEEIHDLLPDERVQIVHLTNNNVVETRNNINYFIKKNISNVSIIGRLDADDEYADEYVLSKIEEILDRENPDIILAGNYLRQEGRIIERKNIANRRFGEDDYLLSRLKQMSEGNPEGELPSCNLFIKPKVLKPYPDIKSGEDHALLSDYLIHQEIYKIYFAEDLLLTIYNLDGLATMNNKQTENYIQSRKELYQNAIEICKTKKRD